MPGVGGVEDFWRTWLAGSETERASVAGRSFKSQGGRGSAADGFCGFNPGAGLRGAWFWVNRIPG